MKIEPLNITQTNYNKDTIVSFDGNKLELPLYTVCRTRYNENFHVFTNDSIIGTSIKLYGEYTELEIELLKNFLNKDSVVYDVGANIGYHTIAFSKLAKHVYAFEPNKKLFECLKKNVTETNTELFNVAISSKNGKLFIEDFDDNKSDNYGELHISDVGQECLSLALDKIDDIYAPDIIKIDVEGHEYEVFLGALETITEYKPIIFYENMHCSDADKIYDMLKQLNYRIYWYPCPNYNPNNYYKEGRNVFGNGGVVNCLALPEKYPRVSNLVECISRDDTIQQAVQRYQDDNKK